MFYKSTSWAWLVWAWLVRLWLVWAWLVWVWLAWVWLVWAWLVWPIRTMHWSYFYRKFKNWKFWVEIVSYNLTIEGIWVELCPTTVLQITQLITKFLKNNKNFTLNFKNSGVENKTEFHALIAAMGTEKSHGTTARQILLIHWLNCQILESDLWFKSTEK